MTDFNDAIRFAQAHEMPWPRDPLRPTRPGAGACTTTTRRRSTALRGPVHARGPVSGVVWQRGREVAAWGEPDRADLTFSVAKTYLALLAGVAQARGLLPDADEPVVERVPGIGFDIAAQPHHHLGAPAGADQRVGGQLLRPARHGGPLPQGRARPAARPPAARATRGRCRRRAATGNTTTCASTSCRWRCCTCSARRCRRCFATRCMRPHRRQRRLALGRLRRRLDRAATASGRRACAVGARRHALGRRRVDQRARPGAPRPVAAGRRHARGRQLLPAAWVRRMRQPCAIAPFYGWLSGSTRDGRTFPGASAAALFMVGAGGHMVWIEPEHAGRGGGALDRPGARAGFADAHGARP